MPSLASRLAGRTELCLSTGSAGFDSRVWSSSGRDRREIEDEDDKGETVRVGGRQTRSKGVWKVWAHFQESFPTPGQAPKQGP